MKIRSLQKEKIPLFKLRAASAPKNKRHKNQAVGSHQNNFLLQMCGILPALAFLGVFVFFAIFIVFKNGFNSYPFDVKGLFTWKVLRIVATDYTFQIALRNSLLYVTIVLPISLIFSLAIAHCLVKITSKRLFNFLQGLFFLPYVTSSLAIAMTFGFVFSSNSSGLFNRLLSGIGLKPQAGLNNPKYAIVAGMMLGFGRALPFQIIMLTIALTRVNRQYYQAASIDGTPPGKQFGKITIPQILPMLMYLVTTGIILSFKSIPLGLFSSERTAELVNAQTVVFGIYDRTLGTSGLQSNQLAAAASIILLAIVLVITIANRFTTKGLIKRYH